MQGKGYCLANPPKLSILRKSRVQGKGDFPAKSPDWVFEGTAGRRERAISPGCCSREPRNRRKPGSRY